MYPTAESLSLISLEIHRWAWTKSWDLLESGDPHHHGLHHIHLVLDGEVDEVGVDEDVERGPEGGVVLEEEGRRDCRGFGGLELVGVFGLLLFGRGSILGLQSRVAGADHPLHGGELLGALGSGHLGPETGIRID